MAQLRAEDVQMEENNKITPPRKNPAHPATVAIESVMLPSIIDAKERREFATVDIPGAFLQDGRQNPHEIGRENGWTPCQNLSKII